MTVYRKKNTAMTLYSRKKPLEWGSVPKSVKFSKLRSLFAKIRLNRARLAESMSKISGLMSSRWLNSRPSRIIKDAMWFSAVSALSGAMYGIVSLKFFEANHHWFYDNVEPPEEKINSVHYPLALLNLQCLANSVKTELLTMKQKDQLKDLKYIDIQNLLDSLGNFAGMWNLLYKSAPSFGDVTLPAEITLDKKSGGFFRGGTKLFNCQMYKNKNLSDVIVSKQNIRSDLLDATRTVAYLDSHREFDRIIHDIEKLHNQVNTAVIQKRKSNFENNLERNNNKDGHGIFEWITGKFLAKDSDNYWEKYIDNNFFTPNVSNSGKKGMADAGVLSKFDTAINSNVTHMDTYERQISRISTDALNLETPAFNRLIVYLTQIYLQNEQSRYPIMMIFASISAKIATNYKKVKERLKDKPPGSPLNVKTLNARAVFLAMMLGEYSKKSKIFDVPTKSSEKKWQSAVGQELWKALKLRSWLFNQDWSKQNWIKNMLVTAGTTEGVGIHSEGSDYLFKYFVLDESFNSLTPLEQGRFKQFFYGDLPFALQKVKIDPINLMAYLVPLDAFKFGCNIKNFVQNLNFNGVYLNGILNISSTDNRKAAAIKYQDETFPTELLDKAQFADKYYEISDFLSALKPLILRNEPKVDSYESAFTCEAEGVKASETDGNVAIESPVSTMKWAASKIAELVKTMQDNRKVLEPPAPQNIDPGVRSFDSNFGQTQGEGNSE